jgi:hypothetical protein
MSQPKHSKLRFACEWLSGESNEGAPGGYDLGHMAFIGADGGCSSKSPSHRPMMLYLSLIELLDATRRFLEAGASAGGFTFTGTGSSFVVEIGRTAGRNISVRCSGTVVASLDAAALGRAILAGAQEFLHGPGSALPSSDAVRPDLERALGQLALCLETRSTP